jgi:hypothetical protein
MKYTLIAVLLAGSLAGCQTVSQADLYKPNFGRAALPSANFDPAAITNGPYNRFSGGQSACNPAYSACSLTYQP